MVKSSNEGVSKVVYMDPTVTAGSGGNGNGGSGSSIGSSPFTMGSLDGLNRDLHSLSKLGIIAEQQQEETKSKDSGRTTTNDAKQKALTKRPTS